MRIPERPVPRETTLLDRYAVFAIGVGFAMMCMAAVIRLAGMRWDGPVWVDVPMLAVYSIPFVSSAFIRIRRGIRAETDAAATAEVLWRFWGTTPLLAIFLFWVEYDPFGRHGGRLFPLPLVLTVALGSRMLFLGVVHSARRARAVASLDQTMRIARAHAIWISATFALVALEERWRPFAIAIAGLAGAVALASHCRIHRLDALVARIAAGHDPHHELRPIGNRSAPPLRASDDPAGCHTPLIACANDGES